MQIPLFEDEILPPEEKSFNMPKGSFPSELKNLINTHSIEGGSDTSDYILANFLKESLDAFDVATRERDLHNIRDDKDYLQKYIEDAKRTEPPKQSIIFDPIALAYAIGMFIGSGNILDQIKKYVFYGKDIDQKKLKRNLEDINEFSKLFANKEDDDGRFELNMDEITINDRLFHSIIGIATESTELMEAMKDGFPDKVNLLEEIGDSSWYSSIMIDELGGNWYEILERNIEKLRHRYPEKFSTEHAIRRDIKGEQTILSALDRG